MEIFKHMERDGYEQLVFCHDPEAGLKAIICIHNSTLGPALGGTRMWQYEKEEDAIIDALRLAKGMSYKNAAAGLNLGGAKAVIIGDARSGKTEALFRAFGRFIQSLNGRYITAEDVGTSVEDMDYIRMETPFVAGLRSTSGDPSPLTAYGTWKGMKACAKEVWGTDALAGKTVAVQGLGHVGYALCKHLSEEKASLIVTDIHKENVDRVVREFGAKAVAPQEISSVKCDIFSPCALGAIVNDQTIGLFQCRIIAGAANNQLKEETHGDMLQDRGILYAPDFILNAGGVINVADELLPGGYNYTRAISKVDGIYNTMEKVIAISQQQSIPTYAAADILAEQRIASIGRVKKTFLP